MRGGILAGTGVLDYGRTPPRMCRRLGVERGGGGGLQVQPGFSISSLGKPEVDFFDVRKGA